MSVEDRTQAETANSRGYTLIDVLKPANLEIAWQQVKRNKGAAGIDGMEIGDFPAFMREHWATLRVKLENGSYKPSPVRRVKIPKDGGGKRVLGIPAVLDRLIQQAIAQVLTPLYDPTFSDHSHGFRPCRSAHDAIKEMVKEGLQKGKRCHVVDCDLEKFFDTVDHQKLMSRLRQRITDPELLALILKYLKAGAISRGGHYEKQLMGVPQGGPLSPLLANILLDELDTELEERGHKFVRYADDFVILCSSQRAGERILRSIRQFLSDKLKLTVNETKSRVVKLAEASFLGFQIVRRKVRWTPKSQKKLKEKVRLITKRTRGHSPSKVITDLALYLRGAFNYYEPGVAFGEARELDRWIRRRVRLYYWKQWGRPRTRRRKLLKLGIGRDEVHKASRSRKGHWRMSHNSIVQRAMTDAWLAEQGVLSLENLWVSIRYPAGPKKQRKGAEPAPNLRSPNR
jgi:RNA-directed DNA polymerase